MKTAQRKHGKLAEKSAGWQRKIRYKLETVFPPQKKEKAINHCTNKLFTQFLFPRLKKDFLRFPMRQISRSTNNMWVVVVCTIICMKVMCGNIETIWVAVIYFSVFLKGNTTHIITKINVFTFILQEKIFLAIYQ